MPVFTVESTYRLPIYRHRSYEAATPAEACQLALNDDDWSDTREDRDSAGETHVTGIWKGRDSAYRAAPCPVPAQFRETTQRKADHFDAMLALLKQIADPDAAALEGDLRQRIDRLIGTGEAIVSGAAEPSGQPVGGER
jgi:hypothetical protein